MRFCSFALIVMNAGLFLPLAQGQALPPGSTSCGSADAPCRTSASRGGRSAENPPPKVLDILLARADADVQNRNATSARALATPANACDLNQDGTVNIVDVQLGTNMYLGTTACTATVEGAGVCNQDVVNRIKTAALGGACVVGLGPHNVTLNWNASSSLNVTGYNLYRSTVSGGPYSKLNSTLTAGTSYIDYNVDGGLTYYYVATAVDSNNVESAYSNQTKAVVPSP